MAIQRLRSQYYITPVSTTNGAFAVRPLIGVTYDFEGNGSTNTIPGSRYRIHEFSVGQSGVIQFSRAGYIDILMAAGGGWGGWAYYNNSTATNYGGGGGGAGGLVLQYNFYVDTNTSYGYSVGSGGVSVSNTNATNSIFGPFTAIAGGRGGHYGGTANSPGVSGGSGGGGSYDWTSSANRSGGSGTIGQGNAGGSAAGGVAGAGGGGYSTVGGNTVSSVGASGGNGIKINFNGRDTLMCAGGGGGSWGLNTPGTGGLVDGFIVGGTGGSSNSTVWQTFNGSTPVSPGSGGGGAGTSSSTTNNGQYGGNGSDGIIMIRYVL